jgi:hypothetical protein
MKRNHKDDEPTFDLVPARDPDPEWAIHIVHDRKHLMKRVERNVDTSESKWATHRKSSYLPCCTANVTLSTLE